jgi:hypothetical protein
LFQRFLVEANDIPPSRLTGLTILQEIHAASPEIQVEIIESCARFFSNGAHPRTIVGTYAEHALRALLHPMLCDTRITRTVDRARQLLAASHALPRGGLVNVFQRLGDTGWTEELRAVVFENEALAGLRSAAFDPLPRPGERWSDAARDELARMAGPERDAWLRVLDFIARHPPSMCPSTAWQEKTSELGAAIGETVLRATIKRWLMLFAPTTAIASTRPTRLSAAAEHNAALLHGLVSMLDEALLTALETEALAQVVRVAFSATDRGAYLPMLGYRALTKLRLHRDILLLLSPEMPFARTRAFAQKLGE